MMRALATAALVAASLLAAVPGQAQPPGSYLRSCRDIRMHDDTLFAVCRTRGREWARTRLERVHRCVGDIGNNDGQLICNRR